MTKMSKRNKFPHTNGKHIYVFVYEFVVDQGKKIVVKRIGETNYSHYKSFPQKILVLDGKDVACVVKADSVDELEMLFGSTWLLHYPIDYSKV